MSVVQATAAVLKTAPIISVGHPLAPATLVIPLRGATVMILTNVLLIRVYTVLVITW